MESISLHTAAAIEEAFKEQGLNPVKSLVLNIILLTKYSLFWQIFLCAAQSVLFADPESDGYYLDIQMYAGFHLYTNQTISAGKKELEEVFTPLMMEYIEQTHGTSNELNTDITPDDIDEDRSGVTDDTELTPNAKSWNFIKLHLCKHLFSNIIRKGVSQNYSTKPNEKMHGPIKYSYLHCSNFKDFLKQILNADQYLLISGLIQSNIDALDVYEESLLPDPENPTVMLDSTQSDNFDSSIYNQFCMLGLQMPSIMLLQNIENHKNDEAFIKLGKFLTRFLPLYDIPLPGGKAVSFTDKNKITEYCLLKVQYTCISDWQLKMDYIWCNPKFFGHPHYDCMLVNAQDEPYIACHVQLFSCTVGSQVYSLALIEPFSLDFWNPNWQQKDANLGLLCFQENKHKDSEFISIHAIICGVVMVPDMSHGSVNQDFFLFDILDVDLFLWAHNNLQDSEAY
ncbi:hypothetical protein J132_05340 [Termitomyces sp. J132]|nr:hypothetical protein J132_05340 [Termitomyces sp. J132]